MTTRRKFIGAAAMAACGFAGRNAIGAEQKKDAFIWAALLHLSLIHI